MKATIIGIVTLVVLLAVGVSLAGSRIISYDTVLYLTIAAALIITNVVVGFVVNKPVNSANHFKYGEANRAA